LHFYPPPYVKMALDVSGILFSHCSRGLDRHAVWQRAKDDLQPAIAPVNAPQSAIIMCFIDFVNTLYIQGVSIKKARFCFFHNSLEWQLICTNFFAAVAERILFKVFFLSCQVAVTSWNVLLQQQVSLFQLMLSVAATLPSTIDGKLHLVHWWQTVEVLLLQPQNDRVHAPAGIVRLLHVPAREGTGTQSMQDGWVTGSRDTWLHSSRVT